MEIFSIFPEEVEEVSMSIGNRTGVTGFLLDLSVLGFCFLQKI